MRGLAAGRPIARAAARFVADDQYLFRRAVRRPAPQAPELPVELIPFAASLDPAILDAVARRAERLGVGADEVLRCHGLMPSALITETIAGHLGLAVDPLLRVREPMSLAAACAGVLARDERGWSRSITIAPRGIGIRRLVQALEHDPGLADHLRLASPEQLNQHVRLAAARALTHEAVHGLNRWRPDLSARGNGTLSVRSIAALACVTMVGAAIASPTILLIGLEYFLALSFSLWTALRLAACVVRPEPLPRIEIPDRFLPVYTLIIPLHREARVVGRLVDALRALDYPPEKLDVKIVLEEDDNETRDAVEALALRAPFEVVILPHSHPRTKPKALAATLPFARGSFVAVYDAEDEPEPRQLRDALAAFKADPGLACVQAKLTIDNVHDGWISSYFATEYAGLFEAFLPALAKAGLPLPLGGTSNHFRVDILRQVGGWDPFNVTEDADLGMRLARFGHRTGTIDSLTWEEAPVGYWQWMQQRTRWFKGWLHPVKQASLVVI
jgi:hypothetical protein